MKKFFACIMVIMMVFAFCTTAFADDTAISHSGTSKTGYYTSDFVEQMNDTRLHCNSAYKNPSKATMGVYPVMKKDGAWVKCAKDTTLVRYFQDDLNIIIGTYPSVRNVYLRIYNIGSYEGQSVYTSGSWTLFA